MTLPRVYPIIDSALGPWLKLGLEATVAALASGGARILQIRHKGPWTRAIFEEATAAVRLCREAGVLVIIDDRADMAKLLGAGLHVGQNDLPPREARRLLGEKAVLGFSSHNPAQLCAAAGEPVTYVALGPVFPTVSKAKPDPVVGLEQVRACRKLAEKPLVAIGGITRVNAEAVLDAGADSLAIIGDLMPDPLTAEGLRKRMEEWVRLVRA